MRAEAESIKAQKLVQQPPRRRIAFLGKSLLPARRTNKPIRPIRRIALPRLKAHKVKGRLYYTYCRGTDKEIYLGDADSILRAVKGKK